MGGPVGKIKELCHNQSVNGLHAEREYFVR